MKSTQTTPLQLLKSLIRLAFCVFLFSTGANLHAQAFTGTFTFDGSTGNVDSFSYNGTPIPGATISALTKNGVTTSSSTSNFRASNWALGATTGSDVFTGTLDPAMYFEFTITAAPGKVINLPSLVFGLGRSGTGPRQWQWRSSVDGFAAPITATALNAGVAQEAGVLTVPDSNSSWTGNEITTSGASYENLSSVTFRLYAYNAESASGTAGLQGPLTFSGTLADGAPVDDSILLGVDPAAVDEGQTSSGTVTLGSAAGAGGVTVTLASSDVSRATVPATVVVAEGQTSVGFTVTTLDDGIFGEDDIVTLTANATGFTQGLTFITVRNTTPVPVLAMSLTAKEVPATQDFDGLGTANTTSIFSGTIGEQTSLGLVAGLSSVSGWYGTQSAGSTTTGSILTANNGSASSGGAYNYGETGGADRSLGALASGGRTMTFGALVSNNSSEVIDTVVVSFTAKIWRSGQNENTVTFGYGKLGIDGTFDDFLTSASAQALSALNITTPAAGTAAQQDGNLPENQIQFVDVPIVGVNLAPGESMFIRWADADAGGSDSGVGIDNVSVYGTDAPALAAPVFDPPAGTYFADQTVRVSNFASYPAGVEVRYTMDGTEPGPTSLLYDDVAGITVIDGTGPVVLKAVAIDTAASESSFPTSETYQFPVNVVDLTALQAAPTGLLYRVTGQVTFTAATSFRNTKFFQDSAAGIQIDDPSGIVTTVYAAGDNVVGITGRLTAFNGQFQLTPSFDFGAPVSTGNTVTPTPVTITTLSNAVQSMLVVLDDVTFQNAGQTFGGGGTTTPIADPSTSGEFTGTFRNIFGDSNITSAPIPAGPNTLTGIVQRTSATVIAVGSRSLADIVFTGTPALSIQSNKLTLNAGGTGETEEATVEIRRVGATDSQLVVDLRQDVAGALAADVDGSLNYSPLPATVTIPAGSSAILIYVVALPNQADFVATMTASATGFDPASQAFSIVGSGGGNTYDTWASGFGLDPATDGAPTADPDGDSFTNSQEYAFGTNPTQGNGSLLTSTASGGNLVVTWLQRSDVTYNVQSTANLATTGFANDGTVTVENGPTEPAPPVGYIRRQFTVPATGAKFYRVTGTTP
jgi:hypothetical protein